MVQGSFRAFFGAGNLTGTPLGVNSCNLEIEGAERYRAALYIRLSREGRNRRALRERQQPAGPCWRDFARQRGVPVAGLYVDGSSIVGTKPERACEASLF